MQEHPDAYIHECNERLKAARSTVASALQRLRISYKQTLNHPKADAAKREAFQRAITDFENQGKTITYIDESRFALSMPRTHGYAPNGQRCFGKYDWHSKGRTNVIGALVGATLLTVGLFAGNTNSDVCHAWTVQDLLPKCPPNAFVVMDNATFHKRADTQAAIRNAGHQFQYQPPYSPDLNPIDKKWEQVKKRTRKTQETIDQLFQNHREL